MPTVAPSLLVLLLLLLVPLITLVVHGIASAPTSHRGNSTRSPYCRIGDTVWEDLNALQFEANYVLDQFSLDTVYTFAFRPCSPAGLGLCDSVSTTNGFLQMGIITPNRRECLASWYHVLPLVENGPNQTVLAIEGSDPDAFWRYTATVTITCDPKAGNTLVDRNEGRVAVTSSVNPDRYNFSLTLASGCACGSGCPPAPTGPVEGRVHRRPLIFLSP
eukprot:TRINITY_DN5038_c0_g3_i1.p1 TRINITY_DN5038_c0_g3~~TRINITY_DN5038_c0_g3_i1.p1  ORF type:complete len:218 (-),score=26.44 TRINITY_DN5038_c0_g3_i1:127-780(-)